MKKKTAILLAATALSALCASTVWGAGWGQDERGYWYQNPTGSYARSGFSTIDGVLYNFDADGYMLTGWAQSDGKWYYFTPGSGAQALNWTQIDGKWYYLDASKGGAMHTGWKTENNKTYYFGSDGAMYQATADQRKIFCTCSTDGSGGGYMYEASLDGSIIKNKNDDVYKIIYDEQGRVKMKDSLSVASGVASGEDFYQYLMCEHYQAQSVHNQKENVRSALGEHMENYAEKYEDDVRGARKYAERFAEWKEKLLKGAQKYVNGTVYEEDFKSYIDAVVQGTFENADEWVDGLPLYYFE